MPAPVASGWSGRRVGLAPTGKAPPCHGARGQQKFGGAQNGTRAIFAPCLSLGGGERGRGSHIRALSVARGCAVKRSWLVRAVTILLLVPSLSLQSASAQQRGGILKVYHWVSPASMSIHEEGGYSASVSGMGCSIISFFTSKTSRKTVWHQSCRNSPANGPGMRRGR